MFCPECGTEVADTAKSCTKCGRSLGKSRSQSGGGSGAVKVLIAVLIVALIASAGYAVWSQLPGDDDVVQGYSPEGRQWVPMKFDPFGIALDVPGSGWYLHFDAQSQVIFKDDLRGTLDIHIIGAIALNPDNYRVDNKPQVFRILNQESIFLEGFGEATYTLAQGNEEGYLVNKHQLYLRRTVKSPNRQPQTFTYLITLSSPSGLETQYAPVFRDRKSVV